MLSLRGSEKLLPAFMPYLRLIFTSLITLLTITALKAQKIKEAAPVTNDTTLARYNKLISHYRYDNPDSAIFYVNKGLDRAKQNKDKAGEAIMLNQLGMINDNRGQFGDSPGNYQEAFNIYRSLHQPKGMATETIRLGVVEMRKGNYDKAIAFFLEALKYSESIQDPFGIMEANTTLAEAYMGQKKYDVALHYLKIAESINSKLPLSNLSMNIFNNFGVIYRETGKLEEAKLYLLKGIQLSDVPEYQGHNITLTNNLASVYALEGNIPYSIQLQKSALQKAIKIHNYIRQLQTLNGLAKSYQNINVDTSLSYLYRAKALAEGRKGYKQVIEALQMIAELYKKKGNYKAALAAKDEEYTLADKYFFKDMSKQVESLQANYELSKSQAKIQELSFINSRQAFERKIILAVAVGSVIILIVIGLSNYRSRRLNKLLVKANHGLDESNRVKDKLFSILGHDLRSPFVSVINLLEIIDDDEIPADLRKQMLNELSVTSKASLDTLTNLLKWGEMQIKGIRINQQEFALKPLVERVIQLLAGIAQNKQITIADDTKLLVLYADPDHIEFVLRNLLSNAIKFTGEGGNVAISSTYDEKKHEVTITVKDSGVGIAPDRLEEIFSLENVSRDGTYNEKGTSLGLMMCKEFTEANNGHIEVSSNPGKGSLFSIVLQGSVEKKTLAKQIV